MGIAVVHTLISCSCDFHRGFAAHGELIAGLSSLVVIIASEFGSDGGFTSAYECYGASGLIHFSHVGVCRLILDGHQSLRCNSQCWSRECLAHRSCCSLSRERQRRCSLCDRQRVRFCCVLRSRIVVRPLLAGIVLCSRSRNLYCSCFQDIEFSCRGINRSYAFVIDRIRHFDSTCGIQFKHRFSKGSSEGGL